MTKNSALLLYAKIEICQNLSGFLEILNQWGRQEMKKSDKELPFSPTETC